MKVYSEDRTFFVSVLMDWTDCGNSYGYENLTAEVTDGAFQGAVTAWPDHTSMIRFLEELRQCERTRSGRASLPLEELELHIESTDALGHFRLRYKLAGSSHTRGSSVPQVLSGGFDLDSEFLLSITNDFAQLVTEERKHDDKNMGDSR